MDLEDKLTSKCWLCVPDRVSLLCYHPGPPTPLTLLVPGVWRQGPGLKKRGREREDKFLLGGVSPMVSSGRSKSRGEFFLFLQHKNRTPLPMSLYEHVSSPTLCHPQTVTLSHHPRSRGLHPHDSCVTAEWTPRLAACGALCRIVADLSVKTLEHFRSSSEVGREMLAKGGSREKGAWRWVRQRFWNGLSRFVMRMLWRCQRNKDGVQGWLLRWKVHFIDQRFVITRSKRVGSWLAGWRSVCVCVLWGGLKRPTTGIRSP